jgi:hypothetical protein
MPSPNGGSRRTADMSLVIETLGSTSGSTVMSIGATMFDRYGNQNLYLVINSFDAQNYGLAVEPKTMQWWKDKAIWPQLSQEIHESAIGVVEACSTLLRFMQQKSPGNVWCNSPKFHLDILAGLFKKARLELPIEYRDERCYRTLMDVAYPQRDLRPGRPPQLHGYKPHHALGDAIYQAHQVIVTHDYLALPGPDGPQPPLDADQAYAAVSALTADEKDALLLRVLTGQSVRLTRDNILDAIGTLVKEADPEPSSSRMRPR